MKSLSWLQDVIVCKNSGSFVRNLMKLDFDLKESATIISTNRVRRSDF